MDDEGVDAMLSVLRNEASTPDEVNDALQIISNVFQEDISTVEAQIYVALAVDTKNGLFKFLMDEYQGEHLYNHTDLKNSAQVLTILEYLVVNFKTFVEPHAESIVSWCVSTLVLETPARKDSLHLLHLTVANCPCLKVDFERLVASVKKFMVERKISHTLQHSVLVLLGEVCIRHPGAMSDHAEWLINTIVCFLNDYETAKHKSIILIEGCFIGLFGYMSNFELPDDQISCIFSHIRSFSILSELKNTATRAALKTYIKYASTFSKFVCNDFIGLIEIFSKWAAHHASEHKVLGFLALTETYRQLKCCEDENKAKHLFELVNADLKGVLYEQNSSVYMQKKAIVGLSELSGLYIKFGKNQELLSVLNTLNNLSSTEIRRDNEYGIGIYVASLAKILSALDHISTDHLRSLSVALIEHFPKVSSIFKLEEANSLETSFFALLSKGQIQLESHTYIVLYQGLVRSCSHLLEIDVQLMEINQTMTTSKSDSYKTYLPIWQHLLTIKSRSKSDTASTVGQIVFKTFVKVFMKIIKKLDLTCIPVSHDDSEHEYSDPALAYQAQTPSDFQILVNLVDLFQDVMPNSDKGLFIDWLPFMFQNIIDLSNKFPLVSGFYKILTVCFQVAEALEFRLDDPELVSKLLEYIKAVVTRISMQKDELQISCLKLILNAPLNFVEVLLDHLDNALSAAVRVGAGYPDLLLLTISSLDKWLLNFPTEKIRAILQTVLPLMKSIIHGSGGYQRDNVQNVNRRLKTGRKIRKKINNPADRQSLTIQKQFILFLGKLESNLYSEFVAPSECQNIPPEASLTYTIQFKDSRPRLELKDLLPRILDIVNSSTDRNTRVTACEVLNSFLLVAIEGTQRDNQNHQLFKIFISTALNLACDADNIVRDIFNPLLLQICRYFAGKQQQNSKETAVVIEVLTEGCSHQFNSSLRDFSGHCVREFVSWSRRQQSETITNLHLTAIIRIISSYSFHPDACKRLGAAVMFTNIYTEIREDTSIVSVYWFQLYHCFFESLEHCFDDECARLLSSCIKHLWRPIVRMKSIFLEFKDGRRIPKGFRGGSLADLAVYAFNKCSSLNRFVRKESRKIFKELLEILGGISIKQFLRNHNVDVIICMKINSTLSDAPLARLDFANWLYENQAIDVIGSDIFSSSKTLLSEILDDVNPTLDKVKLILQFLKNVASLIDKECAQQLASLLFKLKIPAVQAEFVCLLVKLQPNENAFDEFKRCLPKLDIVYIGEQVNLLNWPFFVAFEILNSAMMLTESYDGNDLILVLFNCLFSTRVGRVVSKFINPSLKEQLAKFMCFTLNCGVDIDHLFKFLRDESHVSLNSGVTTKGEVFFNTYKKVIVDHLARFKETVEYLLSLDKAGIQWFRSILENGNKSENIFDFSSLCLNKWNEIMVVMVDRNTILTMLHLLAGAGNKQYGRFVDCHAALQWIYNLLTSKNDAKEGIVKAFALLPHCSSYLETENDQLTISLRTFRRNFHRLFDMGPYTPSSGEGKDINDIYKGLFSSISVTASLVVLRFIAENLSRHASILAVDDLDSILVSVVNNFPKPHVLTILNELFSLLMNVIMELDSVFLVCDRLVVMLQSCSYELLTDFLDSQRGQIYNVLNIDFKADEDRENIKSRIVCVRLLEVLYTCMKARNEQGDYVQIKHENTNFFKQLISKLSSFKIPPGGKVSERKRLYYCACFKFLCAFASQMNKVRIYELYIFQSHMWQAVIDHDKVYEFGMEFTQIPKRKKILTNIRRLSRDTFATVIAYPQSHALFESSLREDVTQFDMTHSAMSQNPFFKAAHEGRAVELELDALNCHEVIAPICALIEYYIEGNVEPDNSNPCWLAFFLAVLIDSNDTKYSYNTKLLILKIIWNLKDLVKPYALQCSIPILKSVVSLVEKKQTNYFVLDLISMLTVWQPDLHGVERELTDLIRLLITSPNTQRKDIAKHILEYIKDLVEKYSHAMDKKALLDFLLNHRTSDNREFESYLSLHLASILLSNKINPTENADVKKLFRWLLECIKSKNSQLASEVLGRALHNAQGVVDFHSISKEVFDVIYNMESAKRIQLFYDIHKFYPEICSNDLFISDLEVQALQDRSTLRRICLEMLLSHVRSGQTIQEAGNIIVQALTTNIPLLIDLGVQIFLGCVRRIDVSDIENILLQLTKLASSSNAEIRLKACEAMIHVKNDTSKFQLLSNEVQNDCSNALLKLLNDSDDSVRKVCDRYWLNLKLLCKDSREKLLCILHDFYSPQTDADFLRYSCGMVLGEISFSPIYDLNIFDQPLANCSYSDYQILTSWRARHATLAPMFAPSVAGELNRFDFKQPISSSAYHEQIRATARSLLYSPTLSDEAVSSIDQPVAGHSRQQETAEFNQFVFKKPKLPFRFYRSSQDSTSYKQRAIAAKDKEEAEVKDRARRRETNVQLLRTYRKGDFPDIQIKHSNFIMPLLALARKDLVVAKQLFINLFQSLTKNIPADDEFWIQVGGSLDQILKTPNVDSLLLNVVFQLSFQTGVPLDPENVCAAAKNSGLLELGSLVIQRGIIELQENDEIPAIKRVKSSDNESSRRWLHLAELFKQLRDSDGHQGIFLDKLCVTEHVMNAVQFEASYQWKAAVEEYKKVLIEKSPSVEMTNFFSHSYLHCLYNLCRWSEIHKTIKGCIQDNVETLWEDVWQRHAIFPLYLKSGMLLHLQGKSDDFTNLLYSAPGTNPLEKTIASWVDENFPKMLTYFNQSCMNFLSDWSQIDNYDIKRKQNHLINLPVLNEVNDIVGVMSAVSKDSAVAAALKNWSASCPGPQSDLITWDTKLTLRKRTSQFLVDKQMVDTDVHEHVENNIRNNQLRFVKSALDLENLDVAMKYLKAAELTYKDAVWQCYRDAATVLRIKLEQSKPEMKVKDYFREWRRLEEKISNAMDVDDPNSHRLQLSYRRNILNISTAIDSLVKLHNINNTNYERDFRRRWIQNTDAILESIEATGENDIIQKGDVYVQIAKFYHKHSPGCEMVKAVLKGMANNNMEARHLFGWILTAENIQDSQEITAICREVPTWKFLLWRHQLLAFMHKKNANFLKHIIKRIATDYPKSLSHGLRVSLEGNHDYTLVGNSFVNEIRQMVLSDPTEVAFVKAVAKVALPILKMRHYLEKAYDKLDDIKEVKNALKEVDNLIKDDDNGELYKEHFLKFKCHIEQLMVQENLTLLKAELKALLTSILSYANSLKTKEIKNRLFWYSPWLSSFQGADYNQSLEIPGQYDGQYEPKVSKHICIVSVKQELLCLESKRKPFKLTFLGNDAKEYSFLVKFGEDLRQDERIQQVLKHMQNTLRSKKLTTDLHLEGFSVIPFTTDCGIIQWLESTKSLKELILPQNSDLKALNNRKQSDHLDEMIGVRGTKLINPSQIYVRGYQLLKDDRAIESFYGCVKSFPEFVLRDALFSLSSSPEHMAYMRINFAKSLAAMNIAHWILGVGDRHLDNILVSTKTGRVIGIDFGMAFGSGAQFLIPVELVPFRLTPQLVNVFSPLKESGWLKLGMVRCLRALREDPSSLLAMLEVFVLEPSLDWIHQSTSLAKDRGMDDTVGSKWYPRGKVDAVGRKLRGVHPTAEIALDLLSGKIANISKPVLERLLGMLHGKLGENVRASMGQSSLTPEQQVTALIDLAMDPLVLSFTYVGWNPWL